ncbi:DUF711 family protein [Tengunoibacter tsumagoiensis]|uniref:UPF0210 protein n=1 Tax=Tengunoibacter tsumagoiensis TaxID=2014871 RepID=A0A402A462_9CHLR|nr:DUF711 family protein [Tengunoibacter tsumagoiensis]GCE13933.1 UPF0210 protein [Tengunoibacter tsumagoiensis]
MVTIRTLTLGIAESHPLPASILGQAAHILQEASAQYAAAGYTVQTLRISTRSLFQDLADWSAAAILVYARELQQMLDDFGLEYCSVGTVQVSEPHVSLQPLEQVADILAATTAISMTVQLATQRYGLRPEAALPTAEIIQRLAHETDEGFGNFRFAMLACVEPGSPFFPSAYHEGPSSLSIGLQGASLLTEELASGESKRTEPLGLSMITERVRTALERAAGPIVSMAQEFVRGKQIRFGGIDLSPAPMGEESIVPALESCGYGEFGDAGTLAVVAALTEAFKSTGLPTCGYCGLMLPVLEDRLLGQRWAEKRLTPHQLLLYSAVCGTGLDTIPLAGKTEPAVMAHLLLDVATLALRLRKPLSARLFPVPGRQTGELTVFTSPYLTNTQIG